MGTLSQISGRLAQAIARIESELPQQAEIAGKDLVALITHRVVQSGKSADGALFSPYSTVPVSAQRYFGKSRTSSAESTIRRKAEKGERVSYRDFRAINNLNTSPKNFEFTGQMWRGFGVLSVQRTSTGAVVEIGGTNSDSEMKMQDNTQRERKSIIAPSAQEIAVVTAKLSAWAQNILNGGKGIN